METDHTAAKAHYMDWLRDAHAMEEQAETMLTAMERRLEHHPELRTRIAQHIQETRHQAERLRYRIQDLGGDTSFLKDLGGKFMATMQGFSGAMASDEVVKGAMFSYAFEHMEIAAYRNLISAATILGDTRTLQVCEEILGEEIAMARWLEEHMGEVVTQFLSRSRMDADTAKR